MGGTKVVDQRMVKVADLLVEALENEGVEFVFGIPGEENIDILEALRTSKKIKLIVTRHEQAAGFMAATYGRLTNSIGVALTTLGPGATNLSTASAFAKLGGFSCLFITGQKGIKDTEQASFQIVDVVSCMRPLTKFTTSISSGNVLSATVRSAVRTATTEKNGPVHLEIPEDVAKESTQRVLFDPVPIRRPVADEKGINWAVDILSKASRPVMLVGAAANRQHVLRALRQFAEDHNIPVVCTQMGKGVIREDGELFMGCAALSSDDFVHTSFDLSDCILCVGHDETEKPPFLMSTTQDDRRCKIIHIGFSPATVSNYWFPDCEVVGDIGNAIWTIGERVKATRGPKSFDTKVFRRMKELYKGFLSAGETEDSFPMSVLRVVEDVRKTLPNDGILSLDNGFYKVFFARHFTANVPNSVLLDNALATMGAGLPNAIAAKLVDPSRKVIAVVGDGGYMMNSAELSTAVQLQLDLVIIVLNDNALGMIEWKQDKANFERFGLGLTNPDICLHAKSFGAKGCRVEKPEQLAQLLGKCLHEKGVHVLEVPIDYKDASKVLAQVSQHKQTVVGHLKEEFPDLGNALSQVERTQPKASKPGTEAQLQPQQRDHKQKGKTQEAKSKYSQENERPEQESEERIRAESEGHLSIGAEGDIVPFYVAGLPVPVSEVCDGEKGTGLLAVHDKYTEEEYCKVALADEAWIEKAIQVAASAGAKEMRSLPPYKRREILLNVVEEVSKNKATFAKLLAIEAGKPIKDAYGEVARLIETFRLAAEETTRLTGEYFDLQTTESTQGVTGMTKRFPIGPCSFISPFNFPLNLVAHKVAPAIAVGCPFVLKPASKTPLGALLLAEILSRDVNMPKSGFSVLPCSRDAGNKLIRDDRFKFFSFTGSAEAGWAMKAQVGKKPVVLELGGNAACVVDDFSQGLDSTLSSIVHGGFYQSGQSCISVQRILVQNKLYHEFKHELVARVSSLVVGDPKDENTFIGPVISSAAADRIQKWIQEAVEKGATLLCGGKRVSNTVLTPAVLENVPADCSLYRDEVFGPVVCIEAYEEFVDAVDKVNDSRFGLQAGIFTDSWSKANFAFEQIDAGGVCINAVPSLRVDAQPYGGIKDSGLGREGVKYAMLDMTETKVLVMKNATQLL